MLTLICGLPRAGKTTYSKRYDNVIHLDSCFSYRGVIHAMRGMKDDVVVEGVYNHAYERKQLLNAYEGEMGKCIWLDTPDEIRSTRPGWGKNCIKPFEPPTYEEGWDEIVIIREGDGDAELHA